MSPRSSKQFAQIRKESRMKILEAGMELFAIQGFHNTSIEQIRKKAGVSKGLIYNYFDSKEDLMNQIVFHQMDESQIFMDAIAKLETAEEKFRYIIDFTFNYLVERKHDSKLLLALALQMDDFPQLKEIILGRYKGTMPLFSSLLEELGVENPMEEAMAIGAILDGLALQTIVLGEALPIDDMKRFILNKYLSKSQTNK